MVHEGVAEFPGQLLEGCVVVGLASNADFEGAWRGFIDQDESPIREPIERPQGDGCWVNAAGDPNSSFLVR